MYREVRAIGLMMPSPINLLHQDSRDLALKSFVCKIPNDGLHNLGFYSLDLGLRTRLKKAHCGSFEKFTRYLIFSIS